VSIDKLMNMNYEMLCLEWNFKGNSCELVSVRKDMRNPYWMAS